MSEAPRPAVADPYPHTRIEPSGGWKAANLSELWQHQDLLIYLMRRELRSLTSSTSLGFFWIVLQPLAYAVVMTIVLGFFVKVPTGDLPYPVVVLSGLLTWSYVTNAISRSAGSMIANSYLLTKVYFPRLIIPAVPILTGLVEFCVLLAVVLAVALYSGVSPKTTWLFLVFPVLLAVGLAIGAGLWLSALSLRFRDVGQAVPVVLQIGTFISPVFYLSSLVPERWRWLYDLNPMVGLIDLTRWALFAQDRFPSKALGITVAAVIALVVTGVFYFRATEDIAADLV